MTSYYESGPVVDVLAQILGRRDAKELDRPLNSTDLQRAERFFKGVRVQITYRGAMKRKYRVIGVTPAGAGRSTFFNGTCYCVSLRVLANCILFLITQILHM